MKHLTVVTLGPGDPNLLTLQCADALRQAAQVVLRTERCPASEWLREQGIAFTTLDDYYDRYDDFDAMHAAMAEALWKQASSPLVFAVPDPGNDGAVTALVTAKPKTARLTILPGVSRADSCLSAMPGAADGGVRIVPAMSLRASALQPSLPLLITELDDGVLAGEAKLCLTEVYDDEQEVTFFPSTVTRSRKPKQIPLYELDRQSGYDHTAAVLVPAVPWSERSRYTMDDLTAIMERLRADDGCPWDRAQTHESLRPYLIEEAWEVSAAIAEGDTDHIADELGDVLFQVVFHASIGAGHGTFTLTDIVTAICAKMLRRHPHVFGTEEGITADRWEELKREERGLNTLSDALADVPAGLPALMRATKVQKKAARAMQKAETCEEAAAGLRRRAEALDPGDDASIAAVLLDCVALCRQRKLDPEQLLHAATDRMIETIRSGEAQAKP